MRATKRLLAALTFSALVVTALPAAAAPADPADCPGIMRTAEVRRGMTGTGVTVARGTTRETFGVEILGVLENAIAPGRDIILVEVSGAVVDGPGIWAGMSGSPVTIGGRLVGAVAYGLTFGPSRIGGLTPAEDLLELATADYGQGPAAPVAIGEGTATMMSAMTGLPGSAFGTLEPLKTPIAMSGAPARVLDHLRSAAVARGLPWLPVSAGGSASRTTSAPAQGPSALVGGDNLSAALSYGDLSAYATGTVTMVCGDTAVAFGHPFFFAGPVTLGANAGESLAVVTDPLFGSFELATLGRSTGVVDQDRLAGIRIVGGDQLELVPVTSQITALDSGRSRAGATQVAFPQILAELALSHVIGNIDSVFDEIGDGSALTTYRLRGTRADGTTWSFHRANRHASAHDLAFDLAFGIYDEMVRITNNPFEDVEVTSIDVDSELTGTRHAYTIGDAEVSLDGETFQPLSDAEPLVVLAGSTLVLRVPLSSVGASAEDRTIDLRLEVPAHAVGDGAIELGRIDDGFFFECAFGGDCSGDGSIESFDDVLAELAGQPRNDELVASLVLWGGGAPLPGDEGPAAEMPFGSIVAEEPTTGPTPAADPLVAEVREQLDRVVEGFRSVPLFVEPGGAVVPGGGVTRVTGADRIATAIALSEATFAASATVVIARADVPADALTGGPLAASLGAPLLLSSSERLSPALVGELRRLGATEAILLGGRGALGDDVARGLSESGIQHIDRIAGGDRYDTARLVALRVGGRHAVVASGTSWADAASAAALAGVQRMPLLLADDRGLPPATATAIRDLGIREVTLVGGTSALPLRVSAAIEDLGPSVLRVAGADRYATAVSVARHALDRGAAFAGEIVVATGLDFPDALAAGPVAASRGGLLLLVNGRSREGSSAALEFLAAHGRGANVTVVGGQAAITPSVLDAVAAAVASG